MEIRRLTAEDMTIYKEIRLEALQQAPEAFESSYEEEALYSETKWGNILTEAHVFGAFERKRLIAIGGFARQTPNKLSHRTTFWGMYVRPDNRGVGVGKKILDKIVEVAAEYSTQIHCCVLVSNKPAIKLYEKCGFRIYGIDPKRIRIGERFYDEYMMICIF